MLVGLQLAKTGLAPNSSHFLDPQMGMAVASWWWVTQTA